jgi:hypothetical protein
VICYGYYVHWLLTWCQSGELELTFMRSSAREAKLQALLFDHSEVRKGVDELVTTCQAFRAEDVRGTRLAHMINTSQLTQQPDFVFDDSCLRDMSIPEVVLLPLAQFLNRERTTTIYSSRSDGSSGISVSPEARFLDKFSFRGVQYSTASCRIRNSHILFRAPQPDSTKLAKPEPGQLIYAFLHHQIQVGLHRAADPSICLCIRPYLPVQPELKDVDESYRKFGFAGGFLSAQELGPHIVVDASSIISHVAITPLHIRGYGVLHILPMDRVSVVSHR